MKSENGTALKSENGTDFIRFYPIRVNRIASLVATNFMLYGPNDLAFNIALGSRIGKNKKVICWRLGCYLLAVPLLRIVTDQVPGISQKMGTFLGKSNKVILHFFAK